jgi:hypothetical protein
LQFAASVWILNQVVRNGQQSVADGFSTRQYVSNDLGLHRVGRLLGLIQAAAQDLIQNAPFKFLGPASYTQLFMSIRCCFLLLQIVR